MVADEAIIEMLINLYEYQLPNLRHKNKKELK